MMGGVVSRPFGGSIYDNLTPQDRLWDAQWRLKLALEELEAAKRAVILAAQVAADAKWRAGAACG
jgi:hypothetical protein